MHRKPPRPLWLRPFRFPLLAALALLLGACVPASYYPTTVPTITPVPTATSTPRPLPTLTPTATVVPTSTPFRLAYEPEFRQADCEFSNVFSSFEGGENLSINCGFLRVPENRLNPDTKFVQIHVAIFRTRDRLPAKDPLVYLAGGPGIGALQNIGLVYDRVFQAFLVNRDVVVFDQRGTGASKPSMRCPEIGVALRAAWQANDVQASNAKVYGAVAECRQSLLDRGVDIGSYNSAENAADLEDLRIALGYESWNLYGSSYGTRLALTAMRDYPDGIRKVILDATYPLEVQLELEFAQNLDDVLLRLFDACKLNLGCDQAYPNLQNTFYSTVSELNREPAVLSVAEFDAIANEFQNQEFVLTGGGLMQLVFQSMYSDDLIPILPRAINDASQGRYNLFKTILGQLVNGDSIISWGMHYAVQCHEEVAFERKADLEALLVDYPHLESALSGSQLGGLGIFELCETFEVGQADPIEALAVSSDIPTLVLAGEFDPITPPRWGQQVAGQLDDSLFFLVPGAGHGVGLSTPCMTEIAQAFLNDLLYPSVWDCIEDLPPVSFRIPLKTVALQNYVDRDAGFRGRRPAGWDELGTGLHQLDDTLVFQVVFANENLEGASADELRMALVEQLTSQFGESSELITLDIQRHNQVDWTLFQTEVNDDTIFIAVGFDDEFAYIVLVNAALDDRDVLYEQVFLPVIAALRPND
jgi:pimeloyl-ACP methyl ester carboxylesterase